MIKYRAAAYLRLSKDDGDKTESNSISGQRKIIYEFLKNKNDIELINERVDDGFSGVSFDRPAFKNLIDDIQKGIINCVIVKDLSRLGRNYIETGYYIERYFPSLGIRFIAVNDCVDSIKKGFGDSLLIPFKNLLNDSYSADISHKIRSSLDVKRKNGDYIGAFAPYGYKKDKINKNKLIKDEYASFIVENIFIMAFLGISCKTIAERLNIMGVLCPKDYINNTLSLKWSSAEIHNILTNEVYTGTLVQGKKSTPNHKIKKYSLKPESMWFRVGGTHEPIVSKSMYNTVNRIIKVTARTSYESIGFYSLSGILYCGICHKKMVHHKIVSRKKEYEYYMCSGYKKGTCKTSAIKETEIINAVKNIINILILLYLGSECAEKIKQKLIELYKKIGFENDVNLLNNRICEIDYILSSVYDDVKNNVITETEAEQIKNFYSNEKKRINKKIEILKNSTVDFDLGTQRVIIIELIKRIIVYNKNLIEIEFNFKI